MKKWNVYLNGTLHASVDMPDHFRATSVRYRLVNRMGWHPSIKLARADRDTPDLAKGHSYLSVLKSEVTTKSLELVTSPLQAGEVGGCVTMAQVQLGAGMLIISEDGLELMLEAARKEGAAAYAQKLVDQGFITEPGA